MALGHAVVEMPLILLLAVGIAPLLASAAVQVGIGLAGGAVLLFLGAQSLLGLRAARPDSNAVLERHPFWTGIAMTAANPYFLVWWATVGLALAVQASALGPAALILFGIVHWLCDLAWLEALSWAGFHGARNLGVKSRTVISVLCAAVLIGFGLKFLFEAGFNLLSPIP